VTLEGHDQTPRRQNLSTKRTTRSPRGKTTEPAAATAKRTVRKTTAAKGTGAKATAAKPKAVKANPAKALPKSAKKPRAKSQASAQSRELLAAVLKSLDDDKAEEIISIDMSGRTPMADFMVVASGRSNRHVAAIAEHLAETLRRDGLKCRVEGLQQGDWVLIDAVDVIVHVFRPEVRAFYNLEQMWSGAESAPAGG
jgi:ribosome-associated protein